MKRLLPLLLCLAILAGCAGASGESGAKAVEGPYPAYIRTAEGRTWGYIDRTGRFLIPPSFQAAEEFLPQGTAVIWKESGAGLIDRTGRTLLEPVYDYATRPADDGSRLFEKDGQRMLVDAYGKVLINSPELRGTLSDGLVPIARQVSGKERWGYADAKGTTVIAPQYEQAEPFAAGRALVQLAEGHYALIDKTGKRLAEYRHPQVWPPADGLLMFRDAQRRFGYLTENGEVAIPARFSVAQSFKDGYAIVNNAGDSSKPGYGVVNRKGEFVVAPQFGYIEPLGAGRFAVAKASDVIPLGMYLPRAIFDAQGKQLTDFRYYDVMPVDQGLIAVSDEKQTYFLDASGARAAGLPVWNGIGTLRLAAPGLIAADVDETLRYVTRDGKVVWEADRTTDLGGGLKVEAVKERSDRWTLVHYPELSGLAAQDVQMRINRQLRELFLLKPQENATQSLDFTAERMGNLLIIHQQGYYYGFGAAHGLPSRAHYHFDLTTGVRYELKDLFRAGSPYQEALQVLIAKQIADREEPYFEKEPKVKPDQSFTVTPEGLIIEYAPYEIASYAQGFQRFLIPWGEIEDLVDQQGPFWTAFHLR